MYAHELDLHVEPPCPAASASGTTVIGGLIGNVTDKKCAAEFCHICFMGVVKN